MKIRIQPALVLFALGGLALAVTETARSGDGMLVPGQRLSEVLVIAAAALLHECGHAVAAWGCGVNIRTLRLDLFGARMELSGMMSYGQELWVAAGGPLVNFLSAALVYPLWRAHGGAIEGCLFLFTVVSLGLGGLNLLPVGTLDGGRILRCAVAHLFGDRAAETVLCLTTALCLGGLWLLSVYALLRAGQMLSLFVFTLCLLFRMLSPDRA